MFKIFIDENRNTFTGKKAEELYNKKNDLVFFKNGGVTQINQERWKEAQFYERKTWIVDGINASDDRNYEHYERFDKYSSIEILSETVNSVLEIGCGPFTNFRTLKHLLPKLEKVILTDPLLEDYLSHPFCFYKNKQIDGLKLECYSVPFEEFDKKEEYDLIIINNVLEHCYDIPKIFFNILSCLRKGGILIFSDVFFNSETIKISINGYDAGHPLRLPEELMNEFLSKFNVVFNKEFSGLYNQHWRNDKYFIGLKK